VALEEGVNIKVILSATSAAWGYLFEKEERIKEIERFKNDLEKLKDLLPKDLNLEIHAFAETDEEINFVKTLNNSDAVLYVALSFATPGLNILLEK
jgi:hypothetical protein